MFGFDPWSSFKFSNRVSENVFGFVLFPAKSGKKASSIENETKLFRTGAPAPDAVLETATGLKSGSRSIGIPTGSRVGPGAGVDETMLKVAVESSAACRGLILSRMIGGERNLEQGAGRKYLRQ